MATQCEKPLYMLETPKAHFPSYINKMGIERQKQENEMTYGEIKASIEVLSVINNG